MKSSVAYRNLYLHFVLLYLELFSLELRECLFLELLLQLRWSLYKLPCFSVASFPIDILLVYDVLEHFFIPFITLLHLHDIIRLALRVQCLMNQVDCIESQMD